MTKLTAKTIYSGVVLGDIGFNMVISWYFFLMNKQCGSNFIVKLHYIPEIMYLVHSTLTSFGCGLSFCSHDDVIKWKHFQRAGNSLAPDEFPAQRPVKRSFDVFFDLRLNKPLSKQSWGWWFGTLSHPSWRHCNDHCSHSLPKSVFDQLQSRNIKVHNNNIMGIIGQLIISTTSNISVASVSTWVKT